MPNRSNNNLAYIKVHIVENAVVANRNSLKGMSKFNPFPATKGRLKWNLAEAGEAAASVQADRVASEGKPKVG